MDILIQADKHELILKMNSYELVLKDVASYPLFGMTNENNKNIWYDSWSPGGIYEYEA